MLGIKLIPHSKTGPLGIRNKKQIGKAVTAFQNDASEMSPIFPGPQGIYCFFFSCFHIKSSFAESKFQWAKWIFTNLSTGLFSHSELKCVRAHVGHVYFRRNFW